MLKTNYERQAVIQRLLNQKEETELESFIHTNPSSPKPPVYPPSISRENDYDIPAEVILSETTKAKQEINFSEIQENMQRYVDK